MDKPQQKSTKRTLKFLQQDSRFSKKNLLIGSILGTYIAITPFLFYLYEGVPQSQVWETPLFTYDSRGWENANLSMWILTGKIIPLFLLFIWFFTNRHWWYHSLLVPIAMYIYQIIALFNSDAQIIDEVQLIYMVPVMAIVIPSIYLIRAKMFNKLNDANKTMEELEEEFRIKPSGFWNKVRQYF